MQRPYARIRDHRNPNHATRPGNRRLPFPGQGFVCKETGNAMRKTPRQYHGNKITNRAAGGDGNRPAVSRVRPVRLSQCMIVKNEEKNIERALAWAKDIAFEQIVVDTGSTDRTVEIAESLGAKIFHFEWIKDFAAAKNFAIEKARGNWIAFLDADEYFTEADTRRLKKHLDKIQREPDSQSLTILECKWLQLKDNGDAFLTNMQRRVFRNNGLRYVGRIHEHLDIKPGQFVRWIDDIEILHTGYTHEAVASTNKRERNIELLREELLHDPNNAALKGYLADSLILGAADENSRREAERLYRDVIKDGTDLSDILNNAYHYIFIKDIADKGPDDYGEVLELLERAKKALPNVPDYAYFAGKLLFIQKKYTEAWENYTLCKEIITESKRQTSRLSVYDVAEMYRAMARIALEFGDTQNAIKYMSMTLLDDKYSADTLISLMSLLEDNQKAGIISDGEKIARLKQFYDFDHPKDKLFLAKCAKDANDTVLMLFFYKSITDADRAALNAESA
jgi:glycosyltransferase involved in cell wall biosynthesis